MELLASFLLSYTTSINKPYGNHHLNQRVSFEEWVSCVYASPEMNTIREMIVKPKWEIVNYLFITYEFN